MKNILYSKKNELTMFSSVFNQNTPEKMMQKLAEAYNTFQNQVGQTRAATPPSTEINQIIETLFTPDFRKTANGEDHVTKRSDLEAQLKGVRDFAGSWAIDCREVIPSICQTKCTLRYFLNTEKAGTFDVLAVLYSANGHVIGRIDEVYYQIAV